MTDSSIRRATLKTETCMACAVAGATSPVLVNLRASPQHHPRLLQIAPTTSKLVQLVSRSSLAMTSDGTECGAARSTIGSALALLTSHSLIPVPDPDRSCHVTATTLNYNIHVEVTLRRVCCDLCTANKSYYFDSCDSTLVLHFDIGFAF